ncbi:MAG: hypothetical protein LBT80_07825, partial [Lactobacillaceae bacterium]|jgi:hypothetical protein|nr:hypothetical protein [Lactobacillaceae bacterium]
MATAPSSAYLRYHFNKKVVDKAPVRTSSTINLSMFTSLFPPLRQQCSALEPTNPKHQPPVALAPSGSKTSPFYFYYKLLHVFLLYHLFPNSNTECFNKKIAKPPTTQNVFKNIRTT